MKQSVEKKAEGGIPPGVLRSDGFGQREGRRIQEWKDNPLTPFHSLSSYIDLRTCKWPTSAFPVTLNSP